MSSRPAGARAGAAATATGVILSEAVDEEGGGEDVDLGLTMNQRRLLYLMSLYSRAARTNSEKEEWIRRTALLVLCYEGVVQQVFDYDYAPQSVLVHGQRVFFNVSQEAASDIDFLREEGLVNGLKLSSTEYEPVTCYQEPIRVVWRMARFVLVGSNGYEKISTVLDAEDVSYVGSAYIPQCLRFGGRPTLSNAHRAAECARAASNIRDVLDEVITLNSVSIIIAEFVPFGANNVAQVNANLGAGERVPGGLFTSVIDTDAAGTKLVVDPGLTSVSILDHSHTRHVNFEADIYVPEDDSIIQVETLGISVNADGTVFYGMQLEAVMDRIKDNISLDQLSRLLVDVSVDSSTILDSLVSEYQRKLLATVYVNNATARDKVHLIIANEITPHLTAEEYMDKGDYENELKQVLGETRAAFDISENDTLVFGTHGLLIAGPNARSHEALLCSYVQFNSMDLFIRNFFARTFLLNDDMRAVRKLINNYESEPLATQKLNSKLQALADDVRVMGEILGFVIEALESCEIPVQPADPAGKALFQRLQLADFAAQLSMRVLDLKKLFDGVRQELAHLRHLGRAVYDMRLYSMEESSMAVLRQVVKQQDTQERTASTLHMIMLILAGLLAFSVLDRLTGTWTVMDSEWMEDFAQPLIRKYPLIWFIINIIFWIIIALVAVRLLYLFGFAAQGTTTVSIRIMQPIILDRFYTYLQSKVTSVEERIYDNKNTIIRVSWEESSEIVKKRFGGSAPRITVEYDKATSYMHSVAIEYNRRVAKKKAALGAMQLREFLAKDLSEAGIFVDKSFAFAEDKVVEVPAAPASVKRGKSKSKTNSSSSSKASSSSKRA